MGDRRYLDSPTGADIDRIIDQLDNQKWSRLDRLCVIAAGVAQKVPIHSVLDQGSMTIVSLTDEQYVERISSLSRSILAKLEEEECK